MSSISINERDNKLLDDLQPGILKHHGRTYAYHLFISFKDKDKAKNWIAEELSKRIISAKRQLLDIQAHHADKSFNGREIVVFALSAFGYNKLGLPDVIPEDKGGAFKAGMKARKEILSDNPEAWEEGLQKDIDALLIVADSSENKVKMIVRNIKDELAGLGELLYEQRGKVLRNLHGVGIEHFGYADGVSQPLFLKEEIESQNREVWNDEADAKEILLVNDPGGKHGVNSCGSFFVFRKLEQNVKGFKKAEDLLNGRLGVKDKNGDDNDELGGAMLVGRFEDGTATVMDSNEIGIVSEDQLNNDFDYRTDAVKLPAQPGNKCPYHAHIRLTNPRNGDLPRITRRGIPFNDVERNEDDLDNDQPVSGVGLLFMCYQKDIALQFEAIQINANKNFDAVIGQIKPGTNQSNNLPQQWGDAASTFKIACFPGYVTNNGGEYFFTPSISFLKSLGDGKDVCPLT